MSRVTEAGMDGAREDVQRTEQRAVGERERVPGMIWLKGRECAGACQRSRVRIRSSAG